MLSYCRKPELDLRGTHNIKKTLAVDGPFFNILVLALCQTKTIAGMIDYLVQRHSNVSRPMRPLELFCVSEDSHRGPLALESDVRVLSILEKKISTLGMRSPHGSSRFDIK